MTTASAPLPADVIDHPHGLTYALPHWAGRRATFARTDRAGIAEATARHRADSDPWWTHNGTRATDPTTNPIASADIDGREYDRDDFGPYEASHMHDSQGIANDYARRARHFRVAAANADSRSAAAPREVSEILDHAMDYQRAGRISEARYTYHRVH